MRRFLLLFAAIFLSLAAFAESSYTIVFNTSTNDNGGNVSTKVSDYIATESQGYVSAITSSTKAYPASTYGVKFNASGSGGAVFTMTLSDIAQVKVTKIVASACLYVNDNNPTISINGKTEQTITSSTSSDYTFEFDGTEVVTEISIKGSTSSKKRFYVQTLTVYYDDSVEDPTDCGLSFKEISKTITVGTEFTLPTLNNPKGVNVTWSSSVEAVATFDAENNLQIHKAGTTTITATLADEGTGYTQNTSASYELTIEKGTPVFAYTESSYSYEMKTGGEGFAAPTLNNPEALVVTYSSSNSEVATVSADGVITPVTRGTAVITATGAANDLWNGAEATLTINITKNIPTLTFANTEVSKFVDEIADYKGETPTVTPTDLVVSYSIANPEGEAEVASINETTGELTFTGATGTATVTATTTETLVYESKEATYTVTVSKRDSGLAFETSKIEKYDTESYDGQVAKYSIEEVLADGFTVTYASDNDNVATVDANTGAVTLTGVVGTAVITATASGNIYYNEATASYTITVSKQYIFADTYAVLVSDVNDLQAGDVIIIANQDASVAMSTEDKNDNFGQTSITLSGDKSIVPSIGEAVLYMELEKDGDYWLFKTKNRIGSNGYLLTSLTSNKLKTVASVTDNKPLATIAIAENGVATVKFNKGEGNTDNNNRNWLRYNKSSSLFSCYGSGQSDVYIYKLVRPEFKADITIAVDETEGDANKITFSNLQESHGLAFDFTGYNVYLNGTEIGGTDVDLSYLPFVPTGNFTISNGTNTYPVTVTWPITDFSTIEAKVTKAEYFAYCDEEHTVTGWEDSMWYLDAEYTIAPDCEVSNLYCEVNCTLFDPDNALGSTVEKKGNNIVCVNRVGMFMLGEAPTFETNVDGSFNVTLTFPFYVETALSDMMKAPEGKEKINSFEGLETTIDVTASAGQVPQPDDTEGTGNISGVESVVVDSEGAVEYYNLQGVRVEGELTPGIYIRRSGNTATKISIR